MKRKITNPPKPVRSQLVPVTVQMLEELEGRLGHKIDGGLIGVRGEMGAMKSGLRAEMSKMKAELKSEMSELKTELKSEMLELKTELRSEMSELKTELRSEMSELKTELTSEMSELKTELKSEMSGIRSEIHRIGLLVEEQNARNKFVLDGYAQLYELIERKLG